MIESNIVKWVDLGDSMQFLDIYGKKKWTQFFNLMKVLANFKKFSIFFYIIVKCLFFLQILMLNLTNITDPDDSAIVVLKYVSNVIFVQEFIEDKSTYIIGVVITTILTVVTVLCIIYLMVSLKIGKFYLKVPISLLNVINVLLLNYLIGPIVQISIMSTNCKGGLHFYLQEECFGQFTHLILFVLSIINLIIFFVLSVVLSIYYNEIGSINETKVCARINCNYEFYTNLSKIGMFVFAYFVKFYTSETGVMHNLLQFYILANCFIFTIYIYRTVLFYDMRMNYIIMYGWVYITWFSAVIFIKTLLKFNDTAILLILGWIILTLIFYNLEEHRGEYLLTEFNIFEAKSLKEIEMFIIKLISLLNQRTVKSKTFLFGIINKFQEIMQANPSLESKFRKIFMNGHLRKKYNSDNTLAILSIIYIIYDIHLEKSVHKDDILLSMSYFLMNKFKNSTYATYLCSKSKGISHKHLYFKYIFMEEMKDHLMSKLSKSNSKETMKNVQIGSVILYNIYVDLLKLKIYDATCNQIDYFDILKNNTTNTKAMENFLKLGEEILSLRKEILKIWEKIVELNPFTSDEDYRMYLTTILQDEILARTEAKRFNTIKTNKLSEKNNLYHSMFLKNQSCVILIDGHSSFGKILYTTPNFPPMFNFSGKEVLNMTIDDLVPNVIREFHNELIDNAIRYSNLNYVFNGQKDFLIKGKTGGIHNVRLFNKAVPNLCYGLIYMNHIFKLQDHNYIIVLDQDFNINGLTETYSQGNVMTNTVNYGLTNSVINNHISIVLPEILLQIQYNNKDGFFIPKNENDFKGTIYPISPSKKINEIVEKILDRIKAQGKITYDSDDLNSVDEYEELLKELMTKNVRPHSVFYKIITKTFLDKHKYHRVYISNDLIALNDNTGTISGLNIGENNDISKKKQKGLKESKISNHLSANKESQKKIKIFHKPDSDHQNFNDEERNQLKDEMNNEDHDIRESLHSSVRTGSTRSSVDSASFNKLKNGILEKKEVFAVKVMRYLCFLYGIATILLIFFSNMSSNQKFENMNKYLSQNLYFNHSKISVSGMYLATLNLKFLKYGYYNNSFCYIPCRQIYSGLLSTIVTDLRVEKQDSYYFYDIFRKVFEQQNKIELEIFRLEERDVFYVSVDNEINLYISYGLKLLTNLDLYMIQTVNEFDTTSNNIVQLTYRYSNNNNITGYDHAETVKNLSSEEFSPVRITLIIEGVVFLILISAFIYFIYKSYSLKSFYLKKLIMFKKPSFDLYLKTLDEWKKKFRNDNGEDEEINNELDVQDLQKSKRSNSSDEGEGKGKNKKGKKDKHDDKNEKDEKKDNEKKFSKNRRGKSKKPQRNLQQEKYEVMKKYFIKWNIFFAAKVILVLIVSASYYLILGIVEDSRRDEILQFDNTRNSVEGIYKTSFDIFLSLKKELAAYVDDDILKTTLTNRLRSNPDSIVTYNGVIYTDPELLLNSPKYQMKLPRTQIRTPQLGNLLMPLISDMTNAPNSIIRLNDLYNSDSCAILFDTKTEDYKVCAKFWSSILLKGVEQSITHMSVMINTLLDELNSLNFGTKKLADVLNSNSTFFNYELYIQYYFFNSYMETVNIFDALNKDNLDDTYKMFSSIMIGYICGIVFLFFLMLYFVYLCKYVFNSFLNFIGILPAKYLLEDPELYRDILKLEQHIYY